MKIQLKAVVYLMTLSAISCVVKEDSHVSVPGVLERAANQSGLNNNISKTYIEALDEIDESLNSIIEMRSIVNRDYSEEGVIELNMKGKIIKGIQVLNSLILESEKKIEQLKLRLRKADAENETLNRIINQMERKLENENEKVMVLKAELSKSNYEIEDLTARIDELENDNIRLMTDYRKLYDESQTAFIAIGSYKELKQKGIVDKQGGILNLGSVSVLNENFSDQYFNKINIEENRMIPIEGKKINLITEHSIGSYELKQADENTIYLHITNPKEFWKTSRYLVVQKL